MSKVSVLIVEDNADKLASVVQMLQNTLGQDQLTLTHKFDVNSAKSTMRSYQFDLLIVDVAVPSAIGVPIRGNEGIELIIELVKRNRYNTPSHIVALSAYSERLDTLSADLPMRYVTAILYDPSTDEWSRRLSDVALHIFAANNAPHVKREYESFLAIICALQTPELDAILAIDWGWEVVAVPGDSAIYHQCKLTRNGVESTIYAAAAARMGMPASAIAASKMINNFSPRFLAMTGIAAGVKEKTHYGDVLLADPCWDWGSGKWKTDSTGELIFAAAPHQLDVDTDIRGKVELIKANKSLLANIRDKWPGDKPDTVLTVHLGAVASGASVLAEGITIERLRAEQHKELLGVEMETYAVYVAAAEAIRPRPLAFSLKSVVDFGDGEKNDKYQKYGAYTSAQVLKVLVEQLLEDD